MATQQIWLKRGLLAGSIILCAIIGGQSRGDNGETNFVAVQSVKTAAYNPGTNFLEWAGDLETLVAQKKIAFRVRTTPQQAELKDGHSVRTSELLEFDLVGAKTGGYIYRFFVDGIFSATEIFVPINFTFLMPQFVMPGPHLLTIAASFPQDNLTTAFGTNIVLFVTGETVRTNDLSAGENKQLAGILEKLKKDDQFLRQYQAIYRDTSLSYARFSQILEAWTMARELFGDEMDFDSDCRRLRNTIQTYDLELLKRYSASMRKEDFLGVISNSFDSEIGKLNEMTTKLEKKSRSDGKKAPVLPQRTRRLVVPFGTGGYTDENTRRIISESINTTNNIGNCAFRGLWQENDWRVINRELKFYSQLGWPVILGGLHGFADYGSKSVEEIISVETGPFPEIYRYYFKLFALKYGEVYGVCSAEFDGGASSFADRRLNPSDNSPAPANRLEAMHGYMRNYRALSKALTPRGRAMHDSDFGLDNSYLTAAGAEIIIHQLCRGENTEIFMSNTRGACRVFGNPWGGVLTQAPMLLLPNLKKSGRIMYPPYNPYTTTAEDNHFLKYLYFCGATIFADEGGYSYFSSEHRRVWSEMTQFVENHPDPGELQINCAVVRGQASGWQGPRGYDLRYPYGFGRVDSFARKGDRYSPISNYGSKACYRDFDYLNVFFPEYGCYAFSKISFTGTPYGQVDIIGAIIPLEGLKRYKLLWFLGLNVMTDDLASKLKAYVRAGGKLIMNVEQLKDIEGKINVGLMKELFGCEPDGMDYVSLSSPDVDLSALKVRAHDDARVLMRNRNGDVLGIGRDYGSGKACLALAQWQWMMPAEWKEKVVKPLIHEVGVPVEIFPADVRMENFVYRNGEDAVVVLMNHRGWEYEEPWFRRRYKEETAELKEFSNLEIKVELNDNKKSQVFEKAFETQKNFGAYEQIRLVARSAGERPGGKIAIQLVDQAGKEWRSAVGDAYDLQDRYSKFYFFGFCQLWDNKVFTPTNLDLSGIVKLRFIFSTEAPDLPISYKFQIGKVELLNCLTDQKITPTQQVLPWTGSVSVNLGSIGLVGREWDVYEMTPDYKWQKITAVLQTNQLTFSCTVPEWKEYKIKPRQ